MASTHSQVGNAAFFVSPFQRLHSSRRSTGASSRFSAPSVSVPRFSAALLYEDRARSLTRSLELSLLSPYAPGPIKPPAAFREIPRLELTLSRRRETWHTRALHLCCVNRGSINRIASGSELELKSGDGLSASSPARRTSACTRNVHQASSRDIHTASILQH